MNDFLHNVFYHMERVAHHPAAGKMLVEKKRKRTGVASIPPKATPDSLDIRDQVKKQDRFRRNPAP